MQNKDESYRWTLSMNNESSEKERSSKHKGLVRLAGGWWLRLIYYERKILLADW
jgi:hypothetical protein